MATYDLEKSENDDLLEDESYPTMNFFIVADLRSGGK